MAIAFVNKTVGTRVSGADSTTITLNGVTAGNLLVLTLALYNASGLGTPTFSGGTFTEASVKQNSVDPPNQVLIYYSANTTGGNRTITVNPFGPAADIDLTLSEYSGALTSGVVDKTYVTNESSITLNASFTATLASGTLAQADELIVAIVSQGGNSRTWTPGGGFSQIGENEDNSTGQTYSAIYKIVSDTAGDTASWSAGTTTSEGGTPKWFACLATFKDAGGAPPPGQPAIRRFGGIPNARFLGHSIW